jgi:hypothetical protein
MRSHGVTRTNLSSVRSASPWQKVASMCKRAALVISLLCFVYVIHAFQRNTNQSSSTSIHTSANKSPLYDTTVHWNPDIQRLWLDYESGDGTTEKPDTMLVLTDYGWNQKNQWKALIHYSRSIRQTELLQGLIDHPLFHPTAYQEIMAGTRNVDPDVTYYTFLDVETCYERCVPR